MLLTGKMPPRRGRAVLLSFAEKQDLLCQRLDFFERRKGPEGHGSARCLKSVPCLQALQGSGTQALPAT